MNDKTPMQINAELEQVRLLHRGHFMPPLLTVLLFIGVMAIIGGLFNRDVPAEMRDVLMVLTGSISTAFTSAVSYWIGSSRGSAEKAATISQLKGG